MRRVAIVARRSARVLRGVIRELPALFRQQLYIVVAEEDIAALLLAGITPEKLARDACQKTGEPLDGEKYRVLLAQARDIQARFK